MYRRIGRRANSFCTLRIDMDMTLSGGRGTVLHGRRGAAVPMVSSDPSL